MAKKFIKQRLVIFLLLAAIGLTLVGCQSVDDSLSGQQEALIKENVEEWFGGKKLEKYVGNNREYDWFIDQGNTGEHSNSNCGPSSVVMAMKWRDEDFEGTVEEAREKFLPNGGWWLTSTVAQYLDSYEVEYEYLMLDSNDYEKATEDLKEIIEEEKIAILCVSMGYITRETEPELRVNRFYDYDDGHFLVVKGYAKVDGETYFEVYDPNNWGVKYEDGTAAGKDRYYLAEELIDSAINWHPFAIVIE